MKASVYTAGDYAGLRTKHLAAYYGYEEIYCHTCDAYVKHGKDSEEHAYHETEWCFVAEFNGETIRIPASKLRVDDVWNTGDCLLKGVAWLLEKYELRLPEGMKSQGEIQANASI